jgi:hypothetical protein
VTPESMTLGLSPQPPGAEREGDWGLQRVPAAFQEQLKAGCAPPSK